MTVGIVSSTLNCLSRWGLWEASVSPESGRLPFQSPRLQVVVQIGNETTRRLTSSRRERKLLFPALILWGLNFELLASTPKGERWLLSCRSMLRVFLLGTQATWRSCVENNQGLQSTAPAEFPANKQHQLPATRASDHGYSSRVEPSEDCSPATWYRIPLLGPVNPHRNCKRL